MIVNTPYTSESLIPNVTAIAREMTSRSQISLIVHRMLKLSLMSYMQLGWNNIAFLPLLARKDFATGVKLLCELEILSSNKKRSLYILHNQMTDMAIALENTRLLQFFFALANTYAFTPAIFTYNPERCVQFLAKIPNLPKNVIMYCPQNSAAFHTFAQHTHLRVRFIEGKV